MKNSILYIVGALALLGGGAFLFLRSKKSKDKDKLALAEMQNATVGVASGGATSGGASSSLSTTSDGVSPSDANINLANATILVGQRDILVGKTKEPYTQSRSGNQRTDILAYAKYLSVIRTANTQLVELDKKLATLGYKVDAIGQLVKI